MLTIFDKNTLLHLRLPFSFFLMPVFFFALSQAESIQAFHTLLLFCILHFFIYPASNSYNSYMDKDTGSIGVLRNPPPVTRKLYHASICLDGAGLALAALINWNMVLLLALYICVSKAYSWHAIRLKKYAYSGWMVVMLFQGGYTFMMVHMCASGRFSADWFTPGNVQAMALSSLLIGGFYPLTQIYQHEEDKARGDMTISYRLGVRGTFVFCAVVFALAVFIALRIFSQDQLLIFSCALAPVCLYFICWAGRAFRDIRHANYTSAMRIAFLSALCMTSCFLLQLSLKSG